SVSLIPIFSGFRRWLTPPSCPRFLGGHRRSARGRGLAPHALSNGALAGALDPVGLELAESRRGWFPEQELAGDAVPVCGRVGAAENGEEPDRDSLQDDDLGG